MMIQRASTRAAVPWRNGRGVQYEIATDGSLPDDWNWRISTANISSDVPFSSYPEIHRQFCIADGNGVVLTVNGVVHNCLPSSITSFSGEDDVCASLIDGPVRALNLMCREGTRRSIALVGEGEAIQECELVVAINGPAEVVVGGEVAHLSNLDALFMRGSHRGVVASGLVAAI